MATDSVCEGGWSIFSITPDIPASHLSAALADPSAIRLAYDIGILELIGLSLTILGVTIAVFAVLGFWIYGHVVDRAAKKETREIAPEIISKMLSQEPELWLKVIRDNPATFRSAIADALEGTKELENILGSVKGDDVANAMQSPDNGEDVTDGRA